MKTSVVLEKLRLEKKEFITSDELKKYCKTFGFEYIPLSRYYKKRKYLKRIFNGIFHINYPEDLKIGRTNYGHLDLVAKGLELKGITNWYFGLHTALRLNNLTHEYFAVDEVINDKLNRSTPMTILDHKFKFIKTPKSKLTFGIVQKNKIRYSDYERTILDFIYMWKQNGIPSEKILHDISEWAQNTSKNILFEYSKHYPKSVRSIMEMIG